MSKALIPCPFVYANGKSCPGHIVRVEAYKADLAWVDDGEDVWRLEIGQPRSHFHVFCSEKGNHSGYRGQDHHSMKLYGSELPKALLALMGSAHR